MSSWIKSIKEVIKRNKYDKKNNITRRNSILDEMSLDNFDEEKYKELIKEQVIKESMEEFKTLGLINGIFLILILIPIVIAVINRDVISKQLANFIDTTKKYADVDTNNGNNNINNTGDNNIQISCQNVLENKYTTNILENNKQQTLEYFFFNDMSYNILKSGDAIASGTYLIDGTTLKLSEITSFSEAPKDYYGTISSDCKTININKNNITYKLVIEQ